MYSFPLIESHHIYHGTLITSCSMSWVLLSLHPLMSFHHHSTTFASWTDPQDSYSLLISLCLSHELHLPGQEYSLLIIMHLSSSGPSCPELFSAHPWADLQTCSLMLVVLPCFGSQSQSFFCSRQYHPWVLVLVPGSISIVLHSLLSDDQGLLYWSPLSFVALSTRYSVSWGQPHSLQVLLCIPCFTLWVPGWSPQRSQTS